MRLLVLQKLSSRRVACLIEVALRLIVDGLFVLEHDVAVLRRRYEEDERRAIADRLAVEIDGALLAVYREALAFVPSDLTGLFPWFILFDTHDS